MEDVQQVRRCFTECSSGMMLLSEIQRWCKENQIGENNMQEQLQNLIDGGEIGRKAIKSSDGNEHVIYWSKKQEMSNSRSNPSTPAAPTKVSVSTPQSSSRSLKRSRHSFISPLLTSKKKPRLEDYKNTPVSCDEIRGKLEFSSQPDSPLQTPYSSSSSQESKECVQDSNSSGELLLAEKKTLEDMLTKKKETLRKLKMVKTYRSKNDLQNLSQLTRQWREVSQEAAEVLLGYSTRQPQPSMVQLLEHFHIDLDLIHYSQQDEAFY